MSTISVIIPAYNVDKYLNRCLDSLLSQCYSDFEVVLVDDGSTDRTGNICDEYAVKDKRIKVLHQSNSGVVIARNKALDFIAINSNSEYVVFVDSDDWVSPTFLEVLLEGITKNDVDVACVEGMWVSEDEKEKCTCGWDRGWRLVSPEYYWTSGLSLCAGSLWTKIYRRKLLQNVRFSDFVVAQDIFFNATILFDQLQIAYRPLPLYQYRINHSSATHVDPSVHKLVSYVESERRTMELFKAKKFDRAAEHSRGRWIYLMKKAADALQDKDKKLAEHFRKIVHCEQSRRKIAFWENRDFYRNENIRFYWIRWLLGVVVNAVAFRGDSWIVVNAWSIIKHELFCMFHNRLWIEKFAVGKR